MQPDCSSSSIMLLSEHLICGNNFRNFADYSVDFVRCEDDYARAAWLKKEPPIGSAFEGFQRGTSQSQILPSNVQKNLLVYFCNTDLLKDHLSNFIEISFDYKYKILITHHSDYNVLDGKYERCILPILDREDAYWWAQNNHIDHPRVKTIPIGVEDPRLGNQSYVLGNYHSEPFAKIGLTDVNHRVLKNFRVHSNRHKIDQATPSLKNQYDESKGNKFYFDALRSHLYCISPDGNGTDCHRHYDALYSRCQPLVERSFTTESLQKYFPLTIIDDWSTVNEYYNQKYVPAFYEDNPYLNIHHFIRTLFYDCYPEAAR